jgi:hypothetical protein
MELDMEETNKQNQISWDMAEDIFEVFEVYGQEIRWFEKVWKDFIKIGLASYRNDIEKHWVLARIVTLGVMFDEFCRKAFEEYTDTDSLIGELESCDLFNPVRLGSMVDKEWLGESDESDLFVNAVNYLVSECRTQVFDALRKIFGNESVLFVSLWLSIDENVKVGKYSDEQYDEILNDDLTGNKMDAFEYVNNGMWT